MNSVILIGRLVRDPELRYTNSQMAIANFTIAVDRPFRSGGEKQADFIRITVFDKQAENCDKYLSKGRQVAISGRIQTGSYTNKDGQTVYTTDVVADRVEFIGNNGGSGSGSGSYGGSYEKDSFGGSSSDFTADDDADVISDNFIETNDDVPF